MTSTKAATNAANRSSLSWSPHLGIAAPPRELCPTPYRFGPTLIARPCDAVVLTRCVRNPRSELYRDKRPILFASPDLPVYKRNKDSMESIIINDGLHMHAIIILRPGTRLKETLVDHFFKKDEGYRSNTWIRTIHV